MVRIDYFSDVLCIWAYGGQVRVDELARRFGDDIELHYRFIPIFAAAHAHIDKNWQDSGGFAGYGEFVQEVAANWSHVDCHPGTWVDVQPASCSSAHLVIKAVAQLEAHGTVDNEIHASLADKTRFEALLWSVREAFFKHGQDVARFAVLQPLVEAVGVDWAEVMTVIENGEAFAALAEDEALRQQYGLQGSPSFVLNEGRQILYGNVGYRIIDANVEALCRQAQTVDGASWY